VGQGLVSVDNSTEKTVLSENSFKGQYDWRAIRTAAFKRLCCLGLANIAPTTLALCRGEGEFRHVALETRVSFLAACAFLGATYHAALVAVVLVTILGQLGIVSSMLFLTKSRAFRSDILVRVDHMCRRVNESVPLDPKWQPRIDPRDDLFETWLRRTGIAVFAKRKVHALADHSDNVMHRLKSNVWEGPVSVSADMSHTDDHDVQHFEDSAVTIHFLTRTNPTTNAPELAALVHFSDPQCAAAWKRSVELKTANPTSSLLGYKVQWCDFLVVYWMSMISTTLFYLVVFPVVLAVTFVMFLWRNVWILASNSVTFWRRQLEKVSFATYQRRKQGEGKSGPGIVNDTMDQATPKKYWSRKRKEKGDDDVVIQQADQDGRRDRRYSWRRLYSDRSRRT
jgi:hypothetical protein